VPAGSGEGGALAAPQTSHDGGGGQSGTPGRGILTLGLVNQGGGGASHDAAGSAGGGALEEEEEEEAQGGSATMRLRDVSEVLLLKGQ